MENKFRVKISQIKYLKDRLREINDNDIHDIVFLDDDCRIVEIDNKILDDFKFTGLNISDFIYSDFYLHGFEENLLWK